MIILEENSLWGELDTATYDLLIAEEANRRRGVIPEVLNEDNKEQRGKDWIVGTLYVAWNKFDRILLTKNSAGDPVQVEDPGEVVGGRVMCRKLSH